MRLRVLAIPFCLALAFVAVVGGRTVSFAQPAPAPTIPMPVQSASAAQLAQGNYIVNNVGMCMDCHGQNMHGGPLAFGPLGAMPEGVKFATRASNLVALSHTRWTVAQMSSFLQTGTTPRGGKADPPMPQYRMTAADADSVAAYLLSLQ
jgi:mono/diheme cytochrome c family protein